MTPIANTTLTKTPTATMSTHKIADNFTTSVTATTAIIIILIILITNTSTNTISKTTAIIIFVIIYMTTLTTPVPLIDIASVMTLPFLSTNI